MNKITELQAELEELEKRIKTITNAQTTINLLEEIKGYFENVQDYLTTINALYEEHMVTSQDYSTRISALEEQMLQVLQKLENGSSSGTSGNGEAFKEIHDRIDALSNELMLTNQELSDRTMQNSTKFTQIENIITTIQTTIQEMQEDISVNSTNISTLATQSAQMQTSINNLTSTQNSLTTTQSNLSSTVSGINSRLTTVEANVDALTGGVDVSAIDGRISNLERTNCTHTFDTYTYRMFLNLTPQKALSSLYYYYKTDDCEVVKQKFKLKYTSNASGTLTIDLMQNNCIVKTFIVDLTENPQEYIIDYLHYPTQNYQNFQFKFTTTTNISFDELDVIIFGVNPILFVTDQDVKVCCFNNETYAMVYEDHCLKSTRVASNEFTLDTTNYTNNTATNVDIAPARSANYGPEITSISGNVKSSKHHMIFDNAYDNRLYHESINRETGQKFGFIAKASELPYSTVSVMETQKSGVAGFIYNNKPAYVSSTNSGNTIQTISDIETFKSGNWYFCTGIHQNNYIIDQTPLILSSDVETISMYEDGYMYITSGKTVTSVSKVGKGGRFATAYYQVDGSINVYINRFNKTFKYNLIKDANGTYTSTLIEVIEDCDCYYELLNNKFVKHTSNGWVLDSITEELSE